jgi:IS5 family transposase
MAPDLDPTKESHASMNSRGEQGTLAMMTGFERYTKKTRRAIFLEEMEQVVPWGKLCARIEPHYPKPGNGRRQRRGWSGCYGFIFCSSGSTWRTPAVEEALYDSATLRQFAGIDLVK